MQGSLDRNNDNLLIKASFGKVFRGSTSLDIQDLVERIKKIEERVLKIESKLQ